MRHGDIIAPKNIYYGSNDYNLSDVGISQADALRKYFIDINVNAIYSSPLKRAKYTARTIFEDKDIIIDNNNEISERSFGIWEGLTYEELSIKHPDECKEWENDWMGYCMKDGESHKDFYTRVTSFADEKIACHSNETICIISHSGVICSIISYLLGMKMEDIWRFKVDKGSICRIKIDNSGYAYIDLLNFIP